MRPWPSSALTINGWRISSLPGDSAHYNGDWLKRAVAAQAGIYGNDGEEAMYPLTRVDSDGQTLDGSKHNYTLTFPSGQLPPVNAFWSLTMYDGKTQLLIENPINRYLDQFADAARHEDECGWLADALHPEQVARGRQGSELAAGSQRPDLPGDAALLAEDHRAVSLAGWSRNVEASGHQARRVTKRNANIAQTGVSHSGARCRVGRLATHSRDRERVRGDDLGLWTASTLGAKAVAAPPFR